MEGNNFAQSIIDSIKEKENNDSQQTVEQDVKSDAKNYTNVDFLKPAEETANETAELINHAKDVLMEGFEVPAAALAQDELQMDGIYEKEKVNVIDMIDICKSFSLKDGGEFKLFDHLNFSISDFKGQGQFISIMGASGCGKSQLIKMLAGLSTPDSGRIMLYGKEYNDKSTLPMVFQQPSVYKWKSVVDNVALPLKLRGVGKEERNKKALEMLKIVGLEEQADKWARYPDLSGGQRQRVALARNLVANSQILLLDEATSALDVMAKREMQDALLNIYYSSEVDPTVINVTHDISEAVYLSNRIYILKPNPCKIYATIDVDFSDVRRTPEIRNTDKFSDYVKQIENIMEEIHNSSK